MEKWINCKNCGHEFSSKLSKCPECGKAHLTVKALVSAVCVIALVLVSGIGIVLGITEKGPTVPTVQETDSTDKSSDKKNESNKKEDKKDSTNKTSSNSGWTDAVSNVISSESSKANINSSKNESSLSSQSSVSSENNSSDQTIVEEQKNYDTGLTNGDGVKYVTIPKYYLDYTYLIEKQNDSNLKFDEFAYTLTPIKQIMGMSKVIKNPNGAATYVFSDEKYQTAIQKKINSLKNSVGVYEIISYVDSVKYSEHFDSYNFKFSVEDLNDEQQANVFIEGISSLEYQYFRSNSENSVTMDFTYSNGRTETIYVEEIIQQALDVIS